MITKYKYFLLFVLLSYTSINCFDSGSKNENDSKSANISTLEKLDSAKAINNKIDIDQNILKGRWMRSDGNYIIEIKSVEANGKLEAAYLNPNPIHVEQAEWKMTENRLMVLIKLQDVNYPGSTYTLEYILANNILSGNYFQAVDKLNYEVYFTRETK